MIPKIPFRFYVCDFTENDRVDYDNAKYICTVERSDYAEFLKLLYIMKEEGKGRDWGNLATFIGDEYNCYEIDDIMVYIPKDKLYIESIRVYLIKTY